MSKSSIRKLFISQSNVTNETWNRPSTFGLQKCATMHSATRFFQSPMFTSHLPELCFVTTGTTTIHERQFDLPVAKRRSRLLISHTTSCNDNDRMDETRANNYKQAYRSMTRLKCALLSPSTDDHTPRTHNIKELLHKVPGIAGSMQYYMSRKHARSAQACMHAYGFACTNVTGIYISEKSHLFVSCRTCPWN